MPSKKHPSAIPSAQSSSVNKAILDGLFSPHDLARLDSYASNMLDYHVIIDLLPSIANLFFTGRLPQVTLSGVQQAILLAIGLQRKDLTDVEKELDLPSSQLLAMFIKVVRKISVAFRAVLEAEVGKDLPVEALSGAAVTGGSRIAMAPTSDNLNGTMTADNKDEHDEVDPSIRAKQRELINALPLDRYGLGDNAKDTNEADEDARWAEAERQIREGGTATVSVKTVKKRKAEDEDEQDGEKASTEKKSRNDKKGREQKHGHKEKHKKQTAKG